MATRLNIEHPHSDLNVNGLVAFLNVNLSNVHSTGTEILTVYNPKRRKVSVTVETDRQDLDVEKIVEEAEALVKEFEAQGRADRTARQDRGRENTRNEVDAVGREDRVNGTISRNNR